MIRLTDDMRDCSSISRGAVWIGNHGDALRGDLREQGIGGLLNVAQDLEGTYGWDHGMEYAQVGLVDGPGNEPWMYCAAVLVLHALLGRRNVMVYCHTGGRSLAVAVMWIHFTSLLGANRLAVAPRSWGEYLKLLEERAEGTLPVINDVHRVTFDKIFWHSLRVVSA